MNLPNTLTLLRLFLAVAFAGLLRTPGNGAAWAALGCFCLAALTDIADGYIARRYRLITVFGQIMDPVADKVLMLIAFVGLACEGAFPGWIVGVIAFREVAVTLARLMLLRRGYAVPAEQAGKMKTVVQVAAVFLALLARSAPSWLGGVLMPAARGILVLALLLTLWSAVEVWFGIKRALSGGKPLCQ